MVRPISRVSNPLLSPLSVVFEGAVTFFIPYIVRRSLWLVIHTPRNLLLDNLIRCIIASHDLFYSLKSRYSLVHIFCRNRTTLVKLAHLDSYNRKRSVFGGRRNFIKEVRNMGKVTVDTSWFRT